MGGSVIWFLSNEWWCDITNERGTSEWVMSHQHEWLSLSYTTTGGKLLRTRFETVRSNRPCDVTTLQPCNHSEADTRILLHLPHAAEHGHTKAYVRTVDSDVVVLAVRCFESLGQSELWVGFGTGNNYRNIPVHTIRSNIGPLKSLALPLFHILIGCDTTSQFLGCGKKTAWAAWSSMLELMPDTLLALTYNPDPLLYMSTTKDYISCVCTELRQNRCGAWPITLITGTI